MKQIAMYQENLDEQVGVGVVCQEVAIITECGGYAKVELYSMYRNANGKSILTGEKVVRESDTFESGVAICKVAGFKPMKEVDRLVNIFDEYEVIYELENGEAIRMYDDCISRKYENADKAISATYRNGFRF